MNANIAPEKELDRNMIIKTEIDKPDIRFYDVRKAPFDVYGLYKYKTEPHFHRIPEDVGIATSNGVASYQNECTGGRVRFATDSPYVAISVDYIKMGRNSHTPFEATAGFDLYEDYPTGIRQSRYVKTFIPPYDSTNKYEGCVDIGEPRLRYYTLNMPIHSVVKNIYVGVADGSTLRGGAEYRNELPVVIYGSSIVHGTGPSRPGLMYSNLLARRLNLNITNIGFSGFAKGEDAIVDYMCGLPMSIFICDYDHNAPSKEHLLNTHLKMYKKFRERQPDTPYIVISRPDVPGKYNESYTRRDVIIDTFRYARENGDENIYYIDGESFFLGNAENDCTVDTTHPNDHGNYLMADAIEWVLRRILNK